MRDKTRSPVLNTNVNGAIASAIERAGFDGKCTFVLGVSGGPDSQALLKAFPHVARQRGHSCVAVGVNHGLRPEADAELDLAERLANRVGVPFQRVYVHVSKGGNLQSRARDVRYSALRAARLQLGAEAIVTAHHADDRAETVLIRLLRASGAGALAVLPERAGDVFRPLLRVPRSALRAYATRWGLEFAQDPSNSDDHYQRVWVRQRVLPLLSERCPDIVSKLNVVADDMLEVVDAGARVGTDAES